MSERATPETTPVWPYPEIVRMGYHRGSGQWCKKHKGVRYYFGPGHSPDEALRRWRQEWPRIRDGLPRHTATADGQGGMTIRDACRRFIAAKVRARDRGEMGAKTVDSYTTVCNVITRTLGPHRRIDSIGQEDGLAILDAIRDRSPKRRQFIVAVSKMIVDWIAKDTGVPVTLGTEFRGPPAKMLRQQSRNRKGRWFSPQQFQTILAGTKGQPVLRALVLLGLNGGFGPEAVGAIWPGEVDLEEGWIENDRPKTLEYRKVPLWPETVKAIEPIYDPEADYLFRTPTGANLVGNGRRTLTKWMRALFDEVGMPDASYRWFRYTFATVAAEVRDDHARKIVMGHAVRGVSEGYVLQFPEQALRDVTDHVRHWAFSSP